MGWAKYDEDIREIVEERTGGQSAWDYGYSIHNTTKTQPKRVETTAKKNNSDFCIIIGGRKYTF